MRTGQHMDWRDKAFLFTINVPDLMVVSDTPGAFESFEALDVSPRLTTLSCPQNRWVAEV